MDVKEALISANAKFNGNDGSEPYRNFVPSDISRLGPSIELLFQSHHIDVSEKRQLQCIVKIHSEL